MRELSYAFIQAAVWAVVCFLTPGCASKPPVDVKAQSATEAEEHVRRVTDGTVKESSHGVSTHLEDAVRQMVENLKLTAERVTFSTPDSMGRQYVTERTTYDLNRDMRKEEHTSVRDTSIQAATNTRNVQTITSRTSEVKENRHAEAERKARITWWKAVLMFLGVCTVIYFISRKDRRDML